MTNRFAVPEAPVAGNFLQRVGGGMTKIKNSARASILTINFLALVTHNNRRFEATVRGDQLVELPAASS